MTQIYKIFTDFFVDYTFLSALILINLRHLRAKKIF